MSIIIDFGVFKLKLMFALILLALSLLFALNLNTTCRCIRSAGVSGAL